MFGLKALNAMLDDDLQWPVIIDLVEDSHRGGFTAPENIHFCVTLYKHYGIYRKFSRNTV